MSSVTRFWPLLCGIHRYDKSLSTRGVGAGHIIEAPILAYLIDTRNGRILYDVGCDYRKLSDPRLRAQWYENPSFPFGPPEVTEEDRLGSRLARLGLDLRDIDCVVCGHLHFDHGGGLHELAHAEVHVHRRELAAMREPADEAYFGDDFAHGVRWHLHDAAFALAEGVNLSVARIFFSSAMPKVSAVARPSLAAGLPGIPARCSEAPERARHAGQGCPPHPQARRPALRAAFTLIEMLVVIAVIGIVAAISVPALKNFKRVDADAAATRQLADEMANARQRAISQRSDVYMVFIPPVQSAYETEATYATRLASVSPQERQQATNLLRLQFTGYGFYSERSVGDQPGQSQFARIQP